MIKKAETWTEQINLLPTAGGVGELQYPHRDLSSRTYVGSSIALNWLCTFIPPHNFLLPVTIGTLSIELLAVNTYYY